MGAEPRPGRRAAGRARATGCAATHWGQGLASEGALALLGHGFDTVGLERVWAQTMAVNTGSVAVMTRIGMRFARTWVGEWNEPLPGWEEGEVEYAVTRQDWRARRDSHTD